MRKMQISFRVPVSVWTGPGGRFLSGSSRLQRGSLLPLAGPKGHGGRFPHSAPSGCSVSHPGDTGGCCDLSLRVGTLLPRSQPSPGCTADPSPPLGPSEFTASGTDCALDSALTFLPLKWALRPGAAWAGAGLLPTLPVRRTALPHLLS